MARTVHIHPKAPPKPAVGSPCRSHGERAGKTKHTMNATSALLQQLDTLSAPELRRLLAEHLTRQKLGLYWERDAIAHDQALNADVVLPRVVPQYGHAPEGCTAHRNLIIEGDNFDSLRLLRSTHAGKVRVIYIDPPYNTGNKDWVYNDKFVGANDRWRHSQWLEFLYQRLLLARDLLTSDGVILVSINDENRARLELLMDEVFPQRIEDILTSLAPRFQGQVLEVELEHGKHHRPYYEIELLQGNGSTLELKIDAVTLELLSQKLED